MGLSSVELWQRIAASQLASPMLCRSWAADAATALTASEALDAERVGEQLVMQGKLTQFQVETLLGDTKLPLIRNGYRLLEPVNYAAYVAPHVRSIWKEWWAVAKSPSSPTLWMRWIQADEFKQAALAQSNPALPRVLQQSQIRHDRLQVVQPPEMASGTLQLSVEPLQGRLLSGLCNGQAHSIDSVMAVISDVAAALTPLHAAGLSHGRVTPDRICLSDSGGHSLLRDPLCSATLNMMTGKSPSATGLLAAQLPAKLDAVHFMAPEFLLPAQVATPQSDLFSLGCVAWLLLTGRAPIVALEPQGASPRLAKQPEQILAAQAEQQLDWALLPKIPEPLLKCLYHCLAKNPGARFSQAGQLVQALQEAQRLVARGPTAQSKAAPVVTKLAESQPVAAVAVSPKAIPDTKPAKATKPVAPAAATPAAQSVPQSAPAAAKPTTKADALPVASKPAQVPAAAVPASPAGNVPAAIVPATTVNKPVVASQQIAAPTPTPTPSQSVTAAESPTTQPTPASPQKRLASPGKPPNRRSAVRKAKKSQKINWLTPVIGGGALLVLILVIMVVNGGSGASSNGSATTKSTPANGDQNQTVPPTVAPSAPVDPLADKFELVSDVPTALWAPPRLNEPLQLDLLPPGGQFFAGLRPARLITQTDAKQLLSLLDTDVGPLWKSIAETSGVPLVQIDQVVLAAYPTESGPPQTALRIKLTDGVTLNELKSKWSAPVDTKVKEHALLVSGAKAFYIQQQPLVDSQNVTEFSVGPTELMREVAELQGVAGAMSGQVEQLHQATDRTADVNLLINPVFFYAEGRAWMDNSPPRFRGLLEKWVTRDMRALMLSTSLSDPWYYELRFIGATDREAVTTSQKLAEAKSQLPQAIESWLVNELPHPHWRAMANRFPNMLRAFDAQTRIGTENGQAIVNGYLPVAAAPNLIYASWMAMQPGSTVSTGNVLASNNSAAPDGAPLTPEQILDRKITLSIDQTGIENVLQAIGEQANEKLPAGTQPLRFELDGAGFQRSGITRNQQIKPNFQVKDQTVRQALILLSKKGNPVQPHDDLTTDDQKLLWVLIDGDKPDKALVSLTSREAAVAAGYKLPAEFVK